VQAIVRAGEAIDVSQREGQWHRKTLLRKEQGRTIGQAQVQGMRIPSRFRLQLSVVGFP
jgi:hypothetical protein